MYIVNKLLKTENIKKSIINLALHVKSIFKLKKPDYQKNRFYSLEQFQGFFGQWARFTRKLTRGSELFIKPSQVAINNTTT